MQRVAVVGLLVAGLLAGCSASPPKSLEDGGQDFGGLDLQATDETGVVRGVVFNEAIQPLGGVSILLAGSAARANATTGDDGLFGFDGLEPGTYFLTASRTTFQTTQLTVDVVAGDAEPTPVKILMLADAASLPYPASFVMDGFITCSARIALTAVPAGQCQASDQSQVTYTLDRTPDWLQSEMVWKSTQALGDAMSLVSECFTSDSDKGEDPCPSGNLVVNRSEGSSPLIIKVDQALAERFTIGDGHDYRLRIFAAGRADTDLINEDANNALLNQTTGGAYPCVAWPAINQGCFRFTGVGVIANQQFKVYTTVFYGYKPPADWLFIQSSDVPDPPR